MSDNTEDDSIFRALASPIRRRLLDALKDNARTTGDLCDRLADYDRCTVMQHLKVLENAGLVVPLRRGRERWNHLNALPIKRIHDRWIGAYAESAASLLMRLEQNPE